jgi:hypothetical protein
VIDVRAQRIIPFDEAPQYAALSYVWGDCEQYMLLRKNLDQLGTSGALAYLPSSRVIKDAMTACTRLDIPYLSMGGQHVYMPRRSRDEARAVSYDGRYLLGSIPYIGRRKRHQCQRCGSFESLYTVISDGEAYSHRWYEVPCYRGSRLRNR